MPHARVVTLTRSIEGDEDEIRTDMSRRPHGHGPPHPCARHRLSRTLLLWRRLGRTRGRDLCRPAPPLWRLCLSSSPLLLRSLLLWVWPAVEVPSPLLGLANTNFRLAKLSPFGSRGGGGEGLYSD